MGHFSWHKGIVVGDGDATARMTMVATAENSTAAASKSLPSVDRPFHGCLVRGAVHAHDGIWSFHRPVAAPNSAAPHDTRTSTTTEEEAEFSCTPSEQADQVVLMRHTSMLDMHGLSFGGCSASHDAHGHGHADEVDVADEERRRARAARRSGPESGAHTQCNIFLDADKSFFDFHGGSGSVDERVKRVTAKMIDIVQNVNVLYAKDPTISKMLTLGVHDLHPLLFFFLVFFFSFELDDKAGIVNHAN